MSHEAKDSLFASSLLTPPSGISLSTRYFLFSCKKKMINHEFEDINAKMSNTNTSKEDFGAGKGKRDKISFCHNMKMSIKYHLPEKIQQHLQHNDPRRLDCKLQNMACIMNSTTIRYDIQ